MVVEMTVVVVVVIVVFVAVGNADCVSHNYDCSGGGGSIIGDYSSGGGFIGGSWSLYMLWLLVEVVVVIV